MIDACLSAVKTLLLQIYSSRLTYVGHVVNICRSILILHRDHKIETEFHVKKMSRKLRPVKGQRDSCANLPLREYPQHFMRENRQ